jgi:hypothetical protein
MNVRQGGFAAAVTLACFAAKPANAVNVSELGLSEAQVRALNAQLTAPVIAPGISFGSPIAFGASWGQMFAGVGGQTIPKTSRNEGLDGSITMGFGLGDPFGYVGLETVASVISVNNDFGEDGNVNFKLHRALPWQGAVAVGVDNSPSWGAAERVDESYYGVYTQVVNLAPDSPENSLPLAFNVGVGDGRFVDDPRHDDVGVFGSIAIVPLRQVSLIVDYTGRDTNVAVSLVPLRQRPIVLTLGAVNLGERRQRDVEFAGGIGYLHRF